MARKPTYEELEQRIKEFERESAQRVGMGEVLRESETMFRVAFEQAPVGMCLVNPDGRFLNVNGGLCHMLGYSESELLSKTFQDITHPDDLNTSNEWVRNLLAGETTIVDLEKRYLHREGRVVWGTVRAFLLRHTDGSPRFFVTHVQDITERKRAEEALRLSEATLRSIVEHSNELFYVHDREHVLTYVSPQCKDILGYTPEELAMKWTELATENPVNLKGIAITEKALERGEKQAPYFLELRRKDGTPVPLEIDESPIKDAEGKVVGITGAARDVTERKRAEEALREAHDIISKSPAVAFLWKKEDGWPVEFVSDNVEGLFGYRAEGFLSGDVPYRKTIHPDDLDRVTREVSRFSRDVGRERFVHEPYRIVTQDGEVKWIHDRTYIRRDETGRITHYQGIVEDITEHKQGEEALRQSERKYRDLYDEAPVGYVELDSQGRIAKVNRRGLETLGYGAEEMLGRPVWEFVVEEDAQEVVMARLAGILPPAKALERTYRTKDGTTVPVIIDDALVRDESGRVIGNRTTIQDLTERKRAEEEKEKLQAQLNQAQKMESVGRLAGGVAHDFNNMLGVIMGNLEMAMMRVNPLDPLYNELWESYKGAQRSTDLVRQLLAFARKQTVSPKVLDLNDTVSGLLKMLRRLMGEEIDLVWMPGHDLWPIKMDPSQVDQILANLAVNAKDAIAGVGKVTIETSNIGLDEAYCAHHPGSVPGQYVLLGVGDNGVGMSKEVLEHLFEPFFTTKEVGKGTGLGLSTIYGIAKQNGGFVYVDSEPGKGTAFKIYLPRFGSKSLDVQQESQPEPLSGGTETVLMVEDEAAILNIGKAMVERLGYNILTASTPGEAIRLTADYPGFIHLVLTDVVMPEMNGRELVEQLKTTHPGLKCLYMSGYTANVIAHHGVLDEGVSFLQKPFSMKDLAGKLREVLDKA